MPLLRALGTQLEVLRLRSYFDVFSPETLRRVLQLCPNAELYLYRVQDVQGVLQIAGWRLRQVTIPYFEVGESFQPIADSLKNLEQCTIADSTFGVTFFRNFFASPKRSLRRLELKNAILNDLRKTIVLDIVARGTGALVEVKCETCHPLDHLPSCSAL